MKTFTRKTKAFTLIELLIVIAIIAILALIAIPNFLEAQTRSKVARVMADMRTIATALESYYVDNNTYPHIAGYVNYWNQWDRGGIPLCSNLTTPIAYITTVMFKDPFVSKKYDINMETEPTQYSAGIEYCNIYLCQRRSGGDNFHQDYNTIPNPEHWSQWVLLSLGPDGVKGPDARGGTGWGLGSYANPATDPIGKFVAWNYDPTNGTISNGDILRWQATSR
ncbi:MAG: prepilin-type N-terminal cleavage/methylation domain-containing protein [Candidatus Sumerlaeota bacterium]|nr:prepilin-type N-terminal cleavage/methylation domain-containing protein [Candidatus Sumerlaeota bacterium]